MIPFSILDLSPICAGQRAGDALRDSIRLAQHAEALGARRVWLAEHHNAAALASSAPEILIGQIAAATRTIRVGSGGVMLPNHSALRVAEQFRVLEALFPGRIDLGVGRAAGTDPRTARLLRRGREYDPDRNFDPQLDELLGYLAEAGGPRGPRPQEVVAIPAGVPAPPLFLLSSSDYGAPLAAQLGLGFAFAHHMSPHGAVRQIARYRSQFQPRPGGLPAPHVIVSTAVVAADSDAEAERLASSGRLALVRMAQGQRDLPLEPPEIAAAWAFDDEERAVLEALGGGGTVGGKETVRGALEALVADTRPDELMVVTHVHDFAARCRSYAIVAEIAAELPGGS